MRTLIVLMALLGLCPAAFAECPVGNIEKALGASLEGLRKTEREVSDVQSTEGGVWRIYRRKDGTLNSIVRLDGGESGMSERRLSVINARTYGISVTRVDYLRHAFIDQAGPNGTAKRTTDYYYFCNGKLVVPAAEYATVDTAAYARAGEEARSAMVLDRDIASDTRALAR